MMKNATRYDFFLIHFRFMYGCFYEDISIFSQVFVCRYRKFNAMNHEACELHITVEKIKKSQSNASILHQY